MYQCQELIGCFSKDLSYDNREASQTFVFDRDEQLFKQVHLDAGFKIINEVDQNNLEPKDDQFIYQNEEVKQEYKDEQNEDDNEENIEKDEENFFVNQENMEALDEMNP